MKNHAWSSPDWIWKSFADLGGAEVHEILSARQEVFVVEREGFRPVGEPYDEDGIPHVAMLRSPAL